MQIKSTRFFAIRLPYLAIIITAILFFWESFVWIANRLALGLVQPFNIIVVLALGFLVVTKFKGQFRSLFHLQAKPMLPSAVMLLAAFGYLFIDNLFGIQTFKTLFFLFFLFGFLGLFVSRNRWLSFSTPILLLFLVLPFGSLLDTYIGFPLRMQTAELVNIILQKSGLLVSDSQSIIGLENRYTQIDTTCSGINVLWAGTILFIAYSILDDLAFGWKWLVFFVLYVLLLLAFNAFRISVLVLLELVFNFTKIANGIHQPLGIVGFVIPSVFLWFLINKYGRKRELKTQLSKEHNIKPSVFFPSTIALCLLVLFGFSSGKMESKSTDIPQKLNHSLPFEHIPLTSKEQAYFNFEKASAQKFKVDFKSIQGSIIVVSSNSFKGHHNPELCLQSIGLKISSNNPILIDNKPVRLLTFNSDKLAGIFWFKNQDTYTDDYSYRVWHDIKNGNKNNSWTQVTALFNQNYTAPDLQEFFTYLNKNIQ